MSAQIFRKCEHPKFVHGRLRNCGRCVACLGRRNAELMTRVRKDLRTYGQGRLIGIVAGQPTTVRYTARFVHLTYNEEKLPENGSLVKKHLQNYLKRVRERIYEMTGFRGIASINAGEYGEENGRAHYHTFLWRLPEVQGLFEALIESWNQSEDGKDCRITVSRMYGNPIKAATYCAGYSTKPSRKYDKKYNESDDDYKRRTGREPPFVTWSHGIGLKWLEENEKMLLEKGMIIVENGKCLAFPRYYRKKLQEKQTFEGFRDEFLRQLDMWKKYDVFFSAIDEEIGFLFAEKKARARVRKDYQKVYNKVRYRAVKLIDFLCGGGNEFCSECVKRAEILASFVSDDFVSWSDDDKRYALSCYMERFRKNCERENFERYQYWLTFYYCQLPRNVRRHVGVDIPFDDCVYGADAIYTSFERFLGNYERACELYDEKICDAVRQQGVNYRRMKEVKMANKYKGNVRYDEVVDKETDLVRLDVCKRRRRRK